MATNGIITAEERAKLAGIWYNAYSVAMAEAVEKIAAPYIGRKFIQTIHHYLGKGLGNKEYEVEVEVYKGSMGYEGALILMGRYTNPANGKVCTISFEIEADPYDDDE